MACRGPRARGAVAGFTANGSTLDGVQRAVLRTLSTARVARLESGSNTSPMILIMASDTLDAWATEASNDDLANSLWSLNSSVGDLTVDRPRKWVVAVSKDLRPNSAASCAS